MKIAIIGAGMAGLAAADGLKAAGHEVCLFDKGRGPGGRMSTRRLATPLGEVSLDHGAQYFTARDPGFCEVVAGWRKAGVAAGWPEVAADAWVGVPGMNAVIRQLADGHAVVWNQQVTGLLRQRGQWWLAGEGEPSGPFDAAVLAIPAEQAATMLALHDFAAARIALQARSQPCWTAMLVFDQPLVGLPAVIRDTGDIAWAISNCAKPGRSGPEAWVVQASAAWSQARLEAASAKITTELLAALAGMADQPLPPPVAAAAHRWRYALSAGTGDGALWNAGLGLGVCGDWLLGPRVECAWLSGRMLTDRISAEDAATAQSGSDQNAPFQPSAMPLSSASPA